MFRCVMHASCFLIPSFKFNFREEGYSLYLCMISFFSTYQTGHYLDCVTTKKLSEENRIGENRIGEDYVQIYVYIQCVHIYIYSRRV